MKDILTQILRLHFQENGPLLIFDLAGIAQRMEALAKMGKTHHLHFLMACKSFPHPHVLNLAANSLEGFDVSNLQEYQLLPAKLSDHYVWLTNPALNFSLLPAFLKKGNRLVVTLESLDQLEALSRIPGRWPYAFRLNAPTLLGQEATGRFGHSWKDSRLNKKIFPLMKKCPHPFVGFHLHHGSEKNQAADYLRMARKMALLIPKIQAETGKRVRMINLGGGIHGLDMPQLEKMAQDLRKIFPLNLQLFLEPGRFLSDPFGHACGQIQWSRKIGKREIHVLDLSALCHLQWSHPRLLQLGGIQPSDPKEGKTVVSCQFFGPTCYENDFIGQYDLIKRTRDLTLGGDPLVIFGNINGYSLALNKTFNGIPKASVHFLE